MKYLLYLILALSPVSSIFSQSSTLVEVTKSDGTKVAINADQVRRLMIQDGKTYIYYGHGYTAVTYVIPGTSTYTSFINESCQTFVIQNVIYEGASKEMAFNVKHVETINPLTSGKAGIILKDTREQYNSVLTYASVVSAFSDCYGSAGMTVVTTDATLAGLGTGAQPLKVAQQGATSGQALKWNGTTWAPGNDLSAVSVTARLTGDGSASALDIAQQGATAGQVLKWNGSSWAPSNDVGGSGTYTAGSGINITGTTISNTGDLSNTNEIQTLSLVGSALTLSSGGGTVTIPSGVSKYDAGNGAIVSATGPGVTFSKVSGVGTFTVPVGVIILGARINGTSADLDGSQAFSVVWPTTLLDDFPSITKINRGAGGTPSGAAPFVYDIDNTPLIQVVGSTASSATLKVINFNSFTNWSLIIR